MNPEELKRPNPDSKLISGVSNLFNFPSKPSIPTLPTPNPTQKPSPTPLFTHKPSISPTPILTATPTPRPTPIPTVMPTPIPTPMPTRTPNSVKIPLSGKNESKQPSSTPKPQPTPIPTPNSVKIPLSGKNESKPTRTPRPRTDPEALFNEWGEHIRTPPRPLRTPRRPVRMPKVDSPIKEDNWVTPDKLSNNSSTNATWVTPNNFNPPRPPIPTPTIGPDINYGRHRKGIFEPYVNLTQYLPHALYGTAMAITGYYYYKNLMNYWQKMREIDADREPYVVEHIPPPPDPHVVQAVKPPPERAEAPNLLVRAADPPSVSIRIRSPSEEPGYFDYPVEPMATTLQKYSEMMENLYGKERAEEFIQNAVNYRYSQDILQGIMRFHETHPPGWPE
jgi:hypothetical protein